MEELDSIEKPIIAINIKATMKNLILTTHQSVYQGSNNLCLFMVVDKDTHTISTIVTTF